MLSQQHFTHPAAKSLSVAAEVGAGFAHEGVIVSDPDSQSTPDSQYANTESDFC